MEVPLIKHFRTTKERIDKFISQHHFTDVNLFGRLYKHHCKVDRIQHWRAPDRVPFSHVLENANFKDVDLGFSVGPTWSTHWFLIDVTVPNEWLKHDVRLRFSCGTAEGLVWQGGQPVQGLTHQNERTDFPLVIDGSTNVKQEIYIEVSCSELVGVGGGGMINPPDPNRCYPLSLCELAVRDSQVYALLQDLKLIVELCEELDEHDHRRAQALHLGNQMINLITQSGEQAYERAHQLATQFFSEKNGEGQHVIHAIGNCHIDTAWLWPYAETRRKTARSFSTTLRLLEQFPKMTFVGSQAQQFAWLKEDYPGLFERIRQYVREGRFIVVGGSWVEADGLIPSGESFIRQFLYGQQFFQKEFGVTCKEFWLPDTFGYSAQLPQIMVHCGINRFLTQKLSWSLVNKFPHSSMHWEGIDGSTVLAHFPPGDSYTLTGSVQEIRKTAQNNQEHGRTDCSVLLYGYGDGGQGPSEDMLERLTRVRDFNPLPRVEFSTPDKFFSCLEKDSHKLNRWVGELYLELHNGTYTTQAQVKALNRTCEFLLRAVELWSTVKVLRESSKESYPSEELQRLWKLLLLNQFHDVLPGTSIKAVYDDALAYYNDILVSGGKLLDDAFKRIIKGSSVSERCIVNSFSWKRREVVDVSSDSNEHLAFVQADGLSITPVNTQPVGEDAVKVYEEGDSIVMENKHVRVVLDSMCRVRSMRLGQREAVRKGGLCNQLVLYDDIPLYWDAWDVMDYHIETGSPVSEVLQPSHVTQQSDLRCSVSCELKVGVSSKVKVTVILDACSPFIRFDCHADWHESHKMLKAEFALSPHSQQASYDIQMGHLVRPTHRNTSWDWARFEVCGHKWVDVSEHGFGVALLNNCKFGFSPHTATTTGTMCISLLRSPKAPDSEADMGEHNFSYAMMPHTDTLQEAGVIEQAYNFNDPLRIVDNMTSLPQMFTLSNPAVILETVKLSEDGTGVILRLYEAFGSHTDVTLEMHESLQFSSAVRCNGLETNKEPIDVEFRKIKLRFSPFQIQSIKLHL